MNNNHFFFLSSEPVGRQAERSRANQRIVINPDVRMGFQCSHKGFFTLVASLGRHSELVAASREAGTALRHSWNEGAHQGLLPRRPAQGDEEGLCSACY